MIEGLKRSEFAKALLVTGMALIVYRAGLYVPLPGFDPNTVALLARAEDPALARLSVFALEISPLFSILILAELAKVFAPRLRQWELTEGSNRLALNRGLLLLALVAATAQAARLVLAYEGVPRLVPAPDLVFRLPAIATLVAGAALLMWLAGRITDKGLGSGLWLIVTAPMLAELPYTLSKLVSYQAAGFVGGPNAVVGGAFIVISVAAVVALVSAGGQTTQLGAACLWPAVLAYTTLPWVLGFVALLTRANDAKGRLDWLERGHPVRIIALVALIAGFAYLYARSERLAGAAPAAVPVIVIVAVLGVIALGCEALPTYLQVPLIITGQPLLVIAIVATSLLNAWRTWMRTRPEDPAAAPA